MLLLHSVLSGLRMIVRYRTTLPIAIAGLALGFAAAMLILLLVRFEYGHDARVPASERIYRIETVLNAPNAAPLRVSAGPPALAPAAAERLAGVEAAVRIEVGRKREFEVDGAGLEATVRAADAGVFAFFGLEMLVGDPETALARPDSLVLTSATAARFFGRWQEALGRSIATADGTPLVVTGVLADLPADSHLAFDGLSALPGALSLSGEAIDSTWVMFNSFVYLRLNAAVAAADLEERVAALYRERVPMIAGMGRDGGSLFEPRVMPLRDIHLHAHASGQMKPPGNPALLRSMLLVSVFVMLVAVANFATIELAILGHRTREVGIRKSLGATRRDIALQFLIEMTLASAFSLLLAYVVVQLALPRFSAFVHRDIPAHLLGEPGFLLSVAGLWLATLALGAAWPASRLARIRPRALIADASSGGGERLRSLMVAAQFAVSSFLIVTTLVVMRQTGMIESLSRGIDTENVLVVPNLFNVPSARVETLAGHTRASPGVLQVSPTSATLPARFHADLPISLTGSDGARATTDRMLVGSGFADILRMRLLAGRWLSDTIDGDRLRERQGEGARGAAVISAGLSRALGIADPAAAVGRRIEVENFSSMGVSTGSAVAEFEIVGVAADVHWGSVREEQGPLFYVMSNEGGAQAMLVRHAPGEGEAVRESLRALWRELGLEMPAFAAVPLNDLFAGLDRGERERGWLFGAFAALAIVLSAIGLYGATAFFVQRQGREVALRKLFGATPGRLMLLLGARFARPAVIAFLLALPLAWIYNRDWLEGFAVRIDFGPTLFLLAFLIVSAVALLTTATLLVEAVRRPPADTLRHD